ncbi:MAG: formate/nitrite transporter family protein [Lachnospiraceae bacterium]|nr:formate/nitrite transporter family protein [Lachnospiraceae bacterium]
MENTQTNSPSEILEGNIKTEVKRVNMPIFKLVLLGILAGMFIAGGAAASNVAMHNISNVGLARLVAGVIFPVGLMMIVLVGGELFTGDCLLILGIMDKKYNVLQAIKVLVIVFITNLLGSVIIAFIVYESGQFNYTDGLLGAFTIKVALSKTGLSFTNAFCSGILCNIFVCLAVLMAASSKQVSGKILGIFFPIMAFVVSGYEHCVANMYYIPAGIIAKMNDSYVAKAKDAYNFTDAKLDGLNIKTFFVDNLIPVTLGNIVGGMLFVGVILYLVNHKKAEK